MYCLARVFIAALHTVTISFVVLVPQLILPKMRRVCVCSIFDASVWYVVPSGLSQHVPPCVLDGHRVSCALGAKLILLVFFSNV